MKLLIIGAKSQVGRELCRLADSQHISFHGLTTKSLDITDAEAVQQTLATSEADYVVNLASYNAIDQAESEEERCLAVNVKGPEHLAKACARLDKVLVQLSCDQVFAGHKEGSYSEQDEVEPLSVFGRSKWLGEEAVRQHLSRHLILRTGWIFSAWRHNFVRTLLREARDRKQIPAVHDQQGSPTPAADVAAVILAIIKQVDCDAEVWGTYHYCGVEPASWHELAQAALQQAAQYDELAVEELQPLPLGEAGLLADRPPRVILNCRKLRNTFGIRQRPWRPGLAQVIKTLYVSGASSSRD